MNNIRGGKVKPLHKIIKNLVIFIFILLVLLGVYQLYLIITHVGPRNAISLAPISSNNKAVLSESIELLPLKIISHEYAGQNEPRYLKVNIEISNHTPDVMQFSPLLQLTAVDSLGHEHVFTADNTITPMGGPIDVGKSAEGYVNFKIESDNIIALNYRTTPDAQPTKILL